MRAVAPGDSHRHWKGPPPTRPTMKLVRSLPLLLAPLTALGLGLQQDPRQDPPREGRQDPATADRPPVEREGVRTPPDGDELPPGVGNRDVGRLDIFGRPLHGNRNRFVDRIRGGWQLSDMQMRGSESRGRTATGFLLIGENYLSLEVHADWEGDAKSIEYDIHQAFTAEYTLDATGRMICRTSIGSYIEEETGRLLWETIGFQREFQVIETGRELVLSYDGGKSRLIFEPRLPQMVGQRDIFGRREVFDPDDTSSGTDIFGRKSTESRGTRDIFGRIVPDEVEEAGGERAGGGVNSGDGSTVIDPRERPPGGGDR